MAPSIIPEPHRPSSTTRTENNLHNPLPLSASQESEVRKLYYARVRARCADEIKRESLFYTDSSRAIILTSEMLLLQNSPTAHEEKRSAWLGPVEPNTVR